MKLKALFLSLFLATPASAQSTSYVQSVGGFEFKATPTVTVQSATYAAGQSLGGLITVSIGKTPGITGILDQLWYASKGGSTVGVVIYVWDKNPANTTCTDKTNFVVSQADNQNLVLAPTLLTPATVVSAQDTITYATTPNLTGNFGNGSGNTNLYICILANGSVTPASTSDVQLKVQGIIDQP